MFCYCCEIPQDLKISNTTDLELPSSAGSLAITVKGSRTILKVCGSVIRRMAYVNKNFMARITSNIRLSKAILSIHAH
jgi:hypothetical protein